MQNAKCKVQNYRGGENYVRNKKSPRSILERM